MDWVAHCTKKYVKRKNLSFTWADGAKLPFQKGSFDIVVMNLVLLNVDSREKIKRIFSEISRVLKPKGVLLFSDLNPICIMTEDLPNRHQIYSPGFSYFKDGDYYTAQNFLENGEVMEFKNRHWTLETYTELLDKAGMNIYKIVEPTYPKNAPIKLTHYKIPEYILLCCRKLK
jgi:ubiquinone/menaquinone biosynthesis C-methylase UbiE